MLGSMVLGSVAGMFVGVLRMTMCHVSVVTRFLVIAFFVMLGGL